MKYVEALKLGYDRIIFDSFQEPSYIYHCVTYKHFLRDGVDFQVVEKNKKLNLIRKKEDFINKLL